MARIIRNKETQIDYRVSDNFDTGCLVLDGDNNIHLIVKAEEAEGVLAVCLMTGLVIEDTTRRYTFMAGEIKISN